jgi:hypothetical protein
MTYSPTIYDWRDTVLPFKQVFLAGGTAVSGGMTIGGAAVESPEPGGRSELRLEFGSIAGRDANIDASWLASRLLNNNVFRIRLWQPTAQLMTDADLGGSTDAGTLFSSDTAFDGDVPWLFDPSSPVTLGAEAGETSFRYNDSGYGRKLRVGHVIGFRKDGYDFAHVVTDINYPTTNRTEVEVSPPLRRRITTSDRVLFRPAMLATCVNAREAVGTYLYGTTMGFGPMRFVEALV